MNNLWKTLISLSCVAALNAASPAFARSSGASWKPTGMMSFYGKKNSRERLHRNTANGEIFDANKNTCAHRKIPLNSYILVTVLETGMSGICKITDRGPYYGGRIIDGTAGFARRLGIEKEGVVKVSIKVLSTPDPEEVAEAPPPRHSPKHHRRHH